jgi:AcrR family transcriptional regulator
MAETSTPSEAGYLDAARACIVAVGWRRTTLTDIARRAGVSRMTIYRRWPDMQTLLGDLLVREWTGLLSDSGLTRAQRGATLARLAQGITTMASAVRDNELFLRIIEVDPELLQPYLFQRLGRNQRWMLELLEGAIKQGQADGSVRKGKPAVIAQSLLLATYGFVLSAHTVELSPRVLDRELSTLVERYLAP